MRFPCSTRALSLALAALAVLPAPGALDAQSSRNSADTPVRFARYAHVANDGTIAFTWHDDIWVANADGSNPRRLTAHVARDFMPRFSPDGRWIAFTSNRMGNNDVYVVPVGGGEPRQLTWYSGDDQALYWTPDGREIVMSSNRGVAAWGSPLYRLPLDGTQPRPMAMDIGRSGMIKQDATLVAFNRSLPSYWRKGYRGNSNADIAVQDLRTGQITELTDTELKQFQSFTHDVHPMWGADGQIYFASERDGIFNLWRIAPSGGAPQQVTRHKEDGVQFPAISPDGKRIIYENDFELWTLDVPGGTPRKLALRLAADPKENAISLLTTSNRADGFAPSPDGNQVAVDFHGEIVIVPSEAGVGERTAVTSSPWRERYQSWSPDGRSMAYVSDESGEEEVWVYDLASAQRRKLTTQESIKGDLTWAPSSRKLAYTGANRLWEVDVAGGAPRELAFNQAGGFTIGQYSADGNWLTYTKRDDDQNADVFVFDVRNRREVNVTRNPFNDTNGVLTPDGKHVVFTSTRDNGVSQLFVVPLARLTEDPNDPLVRERQRRSAGSGAGGNGTSGGAPAARERGDSTNAGAAAPFTVTIDAEGIADRATQLTRGSVAVGAFFLSRDGRTVYFTAGGGGGFGGGGQNAAVDAESPNVGLFAIGVDGQNRRRIAGGVYPQLTPTHDRRAVFFRRPARGGDDADGGSGFEISRLVLATPQRAEPVNFSFPVRVDERAEREQLFEESWRVMKYRFYDEKMHGRDWNAIKARYKPLLAHVGTNEDVYDLANEMIGELNASHTGVNGPPSRRMPSVYTTRHLGFELEPDASGRYRVGHIYKNGPADKEWLGITRGEYVLAVNGTELKSGENYEQLMATAMNEYIPVRLARSASGEGARTVRIASVTSLTDIKYEEWVANNRAQVEKETNGDIAYVHIRSMNQPSLARFRNEIDQYSNKKGIIVDIRYNGGGNIDQELIDILERKPYQFWNNRNGSRTWGRRPRQAIAGPKVMMINARSGSDSEVTPMAFRQLGLGTIVGNPTAAAVIATGSYTLINGGTIRTPGSLVVTYDPTKPNNYGVNLENLGVPPDVWVKNSPNDEVKGVDRELQTAIQEAIKALKALPGQISSDAPSGVSPSGTSPSAR
ncbi:S41 family peptidase [Gemmatimonas sp. UBA7669]|uniref:S41 family peptidase n=1 Tax=Gemmatimonas sp. UBA7669 TaxID=1946568 RepID=UPI0025C04C43|nr:S41 family peptidase [Gemmatimonas sp. UBA7669]